jgi:large subunit ribosomal protein L18
MVNSVRRRQFRLKRRVNRVRNAVKRCSTRQYRLSIFRSNCNTYAQLIDDGLGVTVCSASTLLPDLGGINGGSVEAARAVGKRIGELAVEKSISEATLDRGAYRYHGRVAALADGAREAGLTL